MKILKQVAGIDVAQKDLVVSVGQLDEELSVDIRGRKVFPNTLKGYSSLMEWTQKITSSDLGVQFVMEATGVYHEGLAYFLAEQSMDVVIVLPNKISSYFRTLEVKTINDYTSSEAIAKFGLQRKLARWEKPDPTLKRLRQLCRERNQLIEERTVVKNQLHAEQSEAEPGLNSIRRIKERISFLNAQEKEISHEIELLVKSEKRLTDSVKLITTISGVGVLTAAIVLAETNGFELIRNKRQLVSYAGLDVREKLSGTSVKGKPSISKRGNRYLRKAMYLPALAAIRHDLKFKSLYKRLVQKHGIKMKAVVAVQRRLLEMIYTIHKTGLPYEKDFHRKTKEATSITPAASQAGLEPPLNYKFTKNPSLSR
jgi:transposase